VNPLAHCLFAELQGFHNHPEEVDFRDDKDQLTSNITQEKLAITDTVWTIILLINCNAEAIATNSL
jgi:hypothetical protein